MTELNRRSFLGWSAVRTGGAAAAIADGGRAVD